MGWERSTTRKAVNGKSEAGASLAAHSAGELPNTYGVDVHHVFSGVSQVGSSRALPILDFAKK